MNKPAPAVMMAKAPTFTAEVKRAANRASVDAKGWARNGCRRKACYKRAMGRFGSSRGVRRALLFVAPLRLCLGLLGQTVLVGCSPSAASSAEPSSGGEIFDLPEVTSSPHELRAPRALTPFLRLCKLGDGALSRLAERLARRQSEGQSALDSSELGFALRAEGSPYVWPRTWTLEGEGLQSDATLERMRAWLDSFGDGGERRCGVALVNGGERSVLALVAVDALADLEPVPVQQRAGSWVEVNAKLLVPASDAKLLVLGP